MAVGKGCIKRISTIRQIINGHDSNYCCLLKLFKQNGKSPEASCFQASFRSVVSILRPAGD